MVVAAALASLVRGAIAVSRKLHWSSLDESIHKSLVRVADLQFLLGLLLYVLFSPIVRSALADPRAAMKSSALRFFFVEHITAMVIALAVLHVGAGRVRKTDEHRVKQRRMLVTSLLFCLCVTIGIPWPFRPYGRPWVRTDLPAPVVQADIPEVYERRCAVCHGATGRGDGVAALNMQPPPRDLTDAAWQERTTDQQLRDVISGGGTSRGLSSNMPAHPDLSESDVRLLLDYVRRVRHEQ